MVLAVTWVHRILHIFKHKDYNSSKQDAKPNLIQIT